MPDDKTPPEPKPDAVLDGQDTQPGAEGQDTLAAEEPELVVVIDGEEPESDADDEEPSPEEVAALGPAGEAALRKLRAANDANRKKAREAERAARAAQAEVDRLKQATAPKVEAKPRPRIEDFGYDEDAHGEAMEKWAEEQLAVKAEQAKRKADEEEVQKQIKAKFEGYAAEKKKMPAADFEAAEAAVIAALTVPQQNIIVALAANPAQVVLALGKSPKALAALAAEKDGAKFAYKLAQTEGKITVTTKPKPQAETVLRGGAAGAGGVTLSKQLELAEKEAERTGDRTQVQRIKREMKAAGAA